MNYITYPKIPSPQQFQKDSSISFAFRKDDIVLTHLDWLLSRHAFRSAEGFDAMTTVILADLFMTANFWIKSYHGGNKSMKKERYPAVLGLFEITVNTLTGILGCNRPKLAEILIEIYGRDMHVHGLQVDSDQGRAIYLSKLERELYRVRFKGGLAYQFPWWKGKGTSGGLTLVDSKHSYSNLSRRGTDGKMVEGSKNFGCFVMTVEREIYMAKPSVGEAGQHNGFFHSSFTSGDVVTMAGTMLIKGGEIRGIRADSGHYKPTPLNMGLLLQALAMYHVNLSRIIMYAWDGTNLGSAAEFIKFQMSWHQFERQRVAEIGNRKDSDQKRENNNMPRRFPKYAPAPQVAAQGAAPRGTADNYN